MATVMSEPKAEGPENGLDLNSTLPTAESDGSAALGPESSGGSSVESEDKSEAAPVRAGDRGAVNDIEKKMKRAERFGVPVQLSEVEKRNSRAQRFGTGSTVNNTVDSSKKSSELKKKARAERFGIVQSEISDDVAKKKARIARFGLSSNTDPAEEDKKKVRAIRFSQPVPSSNTNGKGKMEVMLTNPPKTRGGT